MKTSLLGFLFGESQVRDEIDGALEEALSKLFEAEAEDGDLKTAKTSLAAALKACGVTGEVQDDACLHFDDGDAYRAACAALADPENFHKLAELGWVVAKGGDQAMSSEPADFKLHFLEITTVDCGDGDKVPNAEKLRKDAQKNDTTEQDRDDELNPVETKDYTSSDRQKGVGDAKDGADPEGKPKGATKSESVHPLAKYLDGPAGEGLPRASVPGKNLYSADDVANSLLGEGGHKPGCQCGFCKNKGKGFSKKKDADGGVADKDTGHDQPKGGDACDTTGIGKQEDGDVPEGAAAIVANMLEGKKAKSKGKMVAKPPGKVVREDCGAPKCKKSPKVKPVAKAPGKVKHESDGMLPAPPRVEEMTSVGAIPPLEAPMAVNGGPRTRPDAKERLRRLKMRRNPEGAEGRA